MLIGEFKVSRKQFWKEPMQDKNYSLLSWKKSAGNNKYGLGNVVFIPSFYDC